MNQNNTYQTRKKNKVQITDIQLGRGGFGKVFLGKYIQNNTQTYVAIKQVTIPEDDEDEQLDWKINQFIRIQQKILSKFEKKKNPHILYLIDFGQKNYKTYYFVLPLYQWNLKKFINIDVDNPDNGLLDFIEMQKDNKYHIKEEYLLIIISQLIQSLIDFQIQDKLSHRDIKPQNYLVKCVQGKILVSLSDFGGIKKLQKKSQATLTTILGTQNYQPPQLFSFFSKYQNSKKKIKFDPRKFDSWSLAVVIAQLIIQQSFIQGQYEQIDKKNPSQAQHHLRKIRRSITKVFNFIQKMQEYGYSKQFKQNIENFLLMMLQQNDRQRMKIQNFRDGQNKFKSSYQFLTSKLPKFNYQVKVNLDQFFNLDQARKKFGPYLFQPNNKVKNHLQNSYQNIKSQNKQVYERKIISQKLLGQQKDKKKDVKIIIHKDDEISVEQYKSLIQFLS